MILDVELSMGKKEDIKHLLKANNHLIVSYQIRKILDKSKLFFLFAIIDC